MLLAMTGADCSIEASLPMGARRSRHSPGPSAVSARLSLWKADFTGSHGCAWSAANTGRLAIGLLHPLSGASHVRLPMRTVIRHSKHMLTLKTCFTPLPATLVFANVLTQSVRASLHSCASKSQSLPAEYMHLRR